MATARRHSAPTSHGAARRLQFRQPERRRRRQCPRGPAGAHIGRRCGDRHAVLARGRDRDRRADGGRHAALGASSATTISASGQLRRPRCASASGNDRVRSRPRVPVRRSERRPPLRFSLPNTDRTEANRWRLGSFQLYSARNFQPWDKLLKLLAQVGYTRSKASAASMPTLPPSASSSTPTASHAERAFLHRPSRE